MKWIFRTAARLIFAVIACVLMWVFIVAYVNGDSSRSTNIQAASAALQAVGALLSIYVALFLWNASLHQGVKQRQKSILAITGAIEEKVAIVGRIVNNASKSSEITVPTEMLISYTPIAVSAYIKAVESIPMHDLGEKQIVDALLNLPMHLDFFRQAVDRYMLGVHNDSGFLTKLSDYVDQPEEQRKILRTRFGVLSKSVLTQVEVITGLHNNILDAFKIEGMTRRKLCLRGIVAFRITSK